MTKAKPAVTKWDRFLLSVAPGWALRRIQARAFVRSYEAASGGRRTSGWTKHSTSAEAANAPARAALRDISRDLYRNNGWARRGVKRIKHSTVGRGIRAKAVGDTKQVAAAEKLWRAWAGTKQCDFDGLLTFTGLQALIVQTVVQSGECLVLKQTPETDDGIVLPLQLRVVEPDHLDSSKDGDFRKSGGRISQGVEFNSKGRRVAYWVFPHHPGAGATSLSKSVRIPAGDVIHVFMPERPGQSRGVPWLCAAISTVHDFDEYEDAKLLQQKIAACFGAFVTDLDGAAPPLGEVSSEDDSLETLEPGHIEYLAPGKQVTFATPPSASDHASFSATSLRKIASAIGVTYEDLTGDYSQVNYSSARMARLAHYDYVHDWRWSMLIPQLCDTVWEWAMELAVGLGDLREAPEVTWTPPPVQMLDPGKEGLAYTRLIRSGAKTLPQVIRELGEDPDIKLREIAEANAKLDSLGIVLDSDPRRTTASGQAQPGTEEPEPAKSKDGEEDEEA